MVRVETRTVHVPVKPAIPEEILRECYPEARLPVGRDPTVGETEALAEDLYVALAKCNADKSAIRRELEKTPEN